VKLLMSVKSRYQLRLPTNQAVKNGSLFYYSIGMLERVFSRDVSLPSQNANGTELSFLDSRVAAGAFKRANAKCKYTHVYLCSVLDALILREDKTHSI